jgi:hypothetical protein
MADVAGVQHPMTWQRFASFGPAASFPFRASEPHRIVLCRGGDLTRRTHAHARTHARHAPLQQLSNGMQCEESVHIESTGGETGIFWWLVCADDVGVKRATYWAEASSATAVFPSRTASVPSDPITVSAESCARAVYLRHTKKPKSGQMRMA